MSIEFYESVEEGLKNYFKYHYCEVMNKDDGNLYKVDKDDIQTMIGFIIAQFDK